MEQELGLYELADELRIRRAEQQWEFEVPAGFTTRPDEAPTPLVALVDSLARFFKARGEGPRKRPGAEGQYGDERSLGSRDGGGGGGVSSSSSSSSRDGGDGGGGQVQQSVLRRELLPSDFNPDLQLKDIIRSFDVSGSLLSLNAENPVSGHRDRAPWMLSRHQPAESKPRKCVCVQGGPVFYISPGE